MELPNLSIDLAAGASTASACLVDKAIGFATELGTEYINTALGTLKSSVYGAAYEKFSVNGDSSIGQQLLGMGVDCVIAGAIGATTGLISADSFNDNSFPTPDDALEGAASIGDGLATDVLGVAAPTTLTKITPAGADVSFFGDLL